MARPFASWRDRAPTRNPAYRPDIDGLRAFSILAVVVFHFFPQSLTGGFAGVDVFFVISGFLISGILLRNLEAGTFSYADFYRRRIRRIFPALIVVLAAVLAAGWLFLFPDEWKQLTRHVVAGAGFASNLALLREFNGYFDSFDKPLLNLWSLGIEEQFYIVWPLLLALSWKRRSSVLPSLLLVFTLSFALNVGFLANHPQAAFYFPAMRFWELALGALLAYTLQFRPGAAHFLKRAGVASILSLGGVVLLAAALIYLDENRAFPGWWDLLPTCGAALIIAAGPKAWFNRLVLSSRPAVFLGLISYPLYLWHWPLLIFAKLVAPFSYGRHRYQLALILTAVALSALTYWFVEQPLRHHRARMVPWALGLSMAVLAVIGLIGFAGMHPRLAVAEVQSATAVAQDWEYPFGNYTEATFQTGAAGSGPDKVLFLGDSHVEQYFPRVKLLMSGPLGRTHTAVYATHGSCPPLPGVTRIVNGFPCDPYFEFQMRQADDPQVRTVVFGAYWESYFGYAPGGNRRAKLRRIGDDSPLAEPGIQIADYAYARLGEVIRSMRARGKRVFVILSNPTSSRYDPLFMISRVTGKIAARNLSRESAEEMRPILDRLQAAAAASGAVVIDPLPYFCDAAVCRTTDAQGQPINKDGNHLRASWVREHATFIDQIFE